MYDNSRLPSDINLLVHPYDSQFSRWSIHSANKMSSIGPATLPPSKTTSFSSSASSSSSSSSSSSFYLPQSQGVQQPVSPNYVNLRPSYTATALDNHLSTAPRPKSTMICDSNPTDQSMAHLHDLRHRYESKGIVGIVKPIVHQRSYTQLNDQRLLTVEKHEISYSRMDQSNPHHYSTRSLNPSSTSALPTPTSGTASVIYRSRRQPSHGHLNGPPPVAPRRHSSISNNKRLSSHRSSRTASTSSSIAPMNELTLCDDDEQELPPPPPPPPKEDPMKLDVKRLEMFYSSVGTMVKSARSIAHLYITTTRQLAGIQDWSCQQRGVPVWIYNTVRRISSSFSFNPILVVTIMFLP